MKTKTKVIASVLITLILFGGLVGYRIKERNKKQEELKNTKPPTTAVSVILAKKGNIEETFSTTGTVISQAEVNIIPKVSGRLLSLNIQEGSYVNAGRVIGQVEHNEIDAQIAQAKAQASIAQSNLELLQNGPLNTQIAQASASVNQSQSMVTQASVSIRQAEAGLSQARVNYNHAESEYKRYKSLVDQGAIPAQQLSTFKTQLDVSREQVKSAQQQVAAAKQQVNTYKQQVASAQAALQQLKDGNRPEQINSGRGQIEQANAAIKLLQAQLANYTITAPISGIVTKKNVEIGSMVSMSNPIATVSKSTNPDLEMYIPEKQILKVKLGQTVNIDSTAFPDKILKLKIREISPVVDLQTRLIKVKGSIASDLPLKIGMSFDCKIVLNQNNDSIILPAEAILIQDNKKVVYVAVNNKVQEKVVLIGLQTPSEVQIKSGINISDKVITKGNTFVKPGDSIQIQQDIAI
ncbi:MAG: efflux RND transporter periplasmic adaptor subunit [Candidatus Sericytochromatia bacterium]